MLGREGGNDVVGSTQALYIDTIWTLFHRRMRKTQKKRKKGRTRKDCAQCENKAKLFRPTRFVITLSRFLIVNLFVSFSHHAENPKPAH